MVARRGVGVFLGIAEWRAGTPDVVSLGPDTALNAHRVPQAGKRNRKCVSDANDITTFSAASKGFVPPQPKRDPSTKRQRPQLTMKALTVGARVEGNYWGKGRWYPGTITALAHEKPRETTKSKGGKDKGGKDKGGKDKGGKDKGGTEADEAADKDEIPETLRVTVEVRCRVHQRVCAPAHA